MVTCKIGVTLETEHKADTASGVSVTDVALTNIEFNVVVKVKFLLWFVTELDLWISLRKNAFAYKELSESSAIKANLK